MSITLLFIVIATLILARIAVLLPQVARELNL